MRWSRRVGFALGLSLLLCALYAWRPAAGHLALAGTDVAFAAAPTGELEVAPVGRFLTGTDLRAEGAGVAGTLAVTNQTGKTLTVRLRAIARVPDLDGVLDVEISAPGHVLFRGELGELRAWTTQSIRLRPGRGLSLTFRAWVPSGRSVAYQGEIDPVSVQFLSTPVGR
jgi:hypothetical protein